LIQSAWYQERDTVSDFCIMYPESGIWYQATTRQGLPYRCVKNMQKIDYPKLLQH
jgi:hypothetical protein